MLLLVRLDHSASFFSSMGSMGSGDQLDSDNKIEAAGRNNIGYNEVYDTCRRALQVCKVARRDELFRIMEKKRSRNDNGLRI